MNWTERHPPLHVRLLARLNHGGLHLIDPDWHGRHHDVRALTLHASCPDPGNAPHQLRLYDHPHLPDRRLLVMVDAEGGTHRGPCLHAEWVPATYTDPLTAAAARFQIHPDVYAGLTTVT